MPAQLVNALWDQITVIEAQEQLKLYRAMDWPNMKQGPRREEHKKLYRMAYPAELKEAKALTPEQITSIINSRG